ncbi:4Fe-4S binding protein [Candidatus Woesearchaeota archaeon]|nr:4Fe-4S binding protein [Candidatus Woesearchaeota archaeon]
METKKTVLLKFSKDVSNKPVMYGLTKHYDIVFNILKASIDLNKEGTLLVELRGQKENFDKALSYLKENKIHIESLKVKRDDEKCIQCGACVTLCPSGALFVSDRKTMSVDFDKEKCIGCEVCVAACPFRAMKISL